jgi:Na+-driven multidrug efflux pump|eukprot:COSAG01_NODE_60_length_29981_cov_23.262533_26_plen_104_part_00
MVTKLCLAITNSIMMTAAIIVFLSRKDFARIYTDDDEIIQKVAAVTDIYVFFIFLGGSVQCLRGVLAACGQQAINARVSLAASYLVGLPISYLSSTAGNLSNF